MLICILQRIPSLARKYEAQLWALGSALFDITVSIDEEVDPSWLRPKEGYNIEEDLNPDDTVNFGVIAYDRLMGALDPEIMFPVMAKVMEISMSSTDWRYRHAGLMAIAQIGEYCEGTEKVQNIVPILVSHLSHANPKVRFAALHAIGLLSDYMHPDFQEEFSGVLLQPMIAAIEDPVPRIQSHACAALTNFLEHVKQSTAAEVAPILLPKLIKSIREGISIVKENAMTCVSSIAEASGSQFLSYYKELMPFLFECIKQLTAKEYHQFRGQTLECITIISTAVGKAAFAEFAPTLIELMASLQETVLTKGNPQRFYLMGAWQRVCIIMKKDFAPYLPRIVPGMLKIAGSMPTMGVSGGLKTGNLEDILKEVSGDKAETVNVNTTETEEKEMAIQTLQTLATHLEDKYAQYIEETTRVVESFLTFRSNSEVRKGSAAIMPSLLKCLKKAGIPREALVAAGSKFISDLLHAHDVELRSEIKSAQIIALKDTFDIIGHFMAAEDTKGAVAKVLSFFSKSAVRKKAFAADREASKDEEEKEEEEGEEEAPEDDSIAEEEEYQRNATYLLGAIVENHKDEATPMVATILGTVVTPFLSGDSETQRVALFVVVDLLDYLGVEKLGIKTWKELVAVVLTYATKAEHELRQVASYGIGCIAKSGGAAFAEISVQCLTILAAAVEAKEDKKKYEEWQGARDNAIASIGKILKYQPSVVAFGDIWAKWLHYLPLKVDEPEARFAHQFVVDTLLASPEVAVGANGTLLGEIIRIFVGVYETKLVKKATKDDIVKAMKQLSGYSAVVAMLEDIYNHKLKPNDKAILAKIIAAGK